MSRRRSTGPRVVAVAVVAALLAACGSAQSTPAIAPAPSLAPAGAPVVFAALGASETVGAGIGDMPLALRAAWPQLFFNEALPRAATYYNFAIGGITAHEALQRELPSALLVHPTLASVFFTLDDLLHGVTSADYEADLDAAVHALRQGGRATVLVASTPRLEDLPAYRACLAPTPSSPCRLPDPANVPTPRPSARWSTPTTPPRHGSRRARGRSSWTSRRRAPRSSPIPTWSPATASTPVRWDMRSSRASSHRRTRGDRTDAGPQAW